MRTVKIQLTQGYFATVDVEDAEVVMKYRWKVLKTRDLVYAVRNVYVAPGKSKALLMHRAIMQAKRGQIIDHVDRNGLNNSRSNLRFCTNRQNGANSKIKRPGKSKYRGVYWNKERSKWQAQISAGCNKEGVQVIKYLGRFDNERDAAIAYNNAATKEFGEFAQLNKVK